MNLGKRDDKDELPIYEVKGNECIAILGNRIIIKKINFKRIKRFLSKE